MIYARLDGRRVVEIIPATLEIDGRALPLEERFHPDFVAALVPVDATVRPGWLLDGQIFVPPPAAQVTGDEVRAQRDRLLSASDWTQLADAPLSAAQRQAWASYRAALRALPSQPGFPAEIAWPEVPT